MLLRNEFINDHRVSKEARSLVRAGHEVTILAEKCRNGLSNSEVVDNVLIVRISMFSDFSNKVRQNSSEILNREIRRNSIKARILNGIKRNRLRRYLLARSRDIKFFAGALQYAKKNDFDVIHAHDLDSLHVGYRISRKHNIPLIYDSHELWYSNNFVLQKNPLSQLYLRVLERRLIKKTDYVITTTDSRAAALASKYGIKKPVILMNIPQYHEYPKSNKIREILELPEDIKIILYQGGISKNRGIYNIVEAIRDIDKAVLVFIGTGDETENLKRLIIQENLDNKVYVLPLVPVDQLAQYTVSADIGVATYLNSCLSYYLCVPNKLFEFMMARKPLIMSNFPEYIRIANKADIGEIVNPDDSGEIASAIEKLLNDPHRIERIKLNCEMLVKQYYNWEIEEIKLSKIYNSL